MSHQDSTLRMQPPTCAGIRVRSVHDAHIIFHAVMLSILPMVTRRLDTEERRAVRPGNVYVWEERGRHTEATGLGIERWTDGIRWSASRVRDEFLLYHERESGTDFDFVENEFVGELADMRASFRLVKQTYSVYVETPQGRRKWHLTAYFVPATVTQLHTIDDVPRLCTLRPPDGMYTSAKMGKGRARGQDYFQTDIHGSAASPGGAVDGTVAGVSGHHPYPSSAYPPYSGYPPQPHQGGSASPVSPLSLRPPAWSAGSPPRSETQVLPNPARYLPPLPLQPAPPVQSPYSPRHPLDDEALRSLGRKV